MPAVGIETGREPEILISNYKRTVMGGYLGPYEAFMAQVFIKK